MAVVYIGLHSERAYNALWYVIDSIHHAQFLARFATTAILKQTLKQLQGSVIARLCTGEVVISSQSNLYEKISSYHGFEVSDREVLRTMSAFIEIIQYENLTGRHVQKPLSKDKVDETWSFNAINTQFSWFILDEFSIYIEHISKTFAMKPSLEARNIFTSGKTSGSSSTG
jgi:hypothetical protein